MSEKNLYDGNCPVLYALSIIGGKWRLPIIWKLSKGSLRYNELKRQIHGITNIMLTRSLKGLEEEDVIKRIQYSQIPPHVEYSLTERGEKLIPALIHIQQWGKEQFEIKFCQEQNI